MSDVDAKREASVKAKEEARKAKNEEIKANKAKLAAERADGKSAIEKAEAEKKAKIEESARKREENIKAKEKERAERAAAEAGKPKAKSSKYSKKDVDMLWKVFSEYDVDGSGQISLQEFGKVLKEKKAANAPRPGQKSTLQERQAQQGISLLDLSEGVFSEMDADGSGDVTFEELLRLMYGRYATEEEMATMLSWVAKEPEPEPEPEPEMSDETKKEIKAIFKLYDKDKSGTLTLKEITGALAGTGLEKDEIKKAIEEYDSNGDAMIDLQEFMKLMKSTGAFD